MKRGIATDNNRAHVTTPFRHQFNRASKFEWKHSRECHRKADQLKAEIGGEAMWKSICSLLMISTACVPAQAVQFSCVFAGNNTPCMVDTENANGGQCKQAYPSQNVTAVCEGGPMSGGSEIDCYFAKGSQNTRKLSENELSSSSNLAKAMAQWSYTTVGIEYITNKGVAILRVAYTSNDGFGADAVCTPK